MNLKRARQLLVVNRSSLLVIALLILLLASDGWNIWHDRHEQERLAQVKEVERASIAAAALAREHAERAENRRLAIDARSDTRVQQLYDEINQLTRLSERVLLPDQVNRPSSTLTSRQEKTAGSP